MNPSIFNSSEFYVNFNVNFRDCDVGEIPVFISD